MFVNSDNYIKIFKDMVNRTVLVNCTHDSSGWAN